MNAIALSLNRASRGLLLDPMNGLADLGRKELRTLYPTAFYDDPARLLRLVRLRLRLGYAVEEKDASRNTKTPATRRSRRSIPTGAVRGVEAYRQRAESVEVCTLGRRGCWRLFRRP